MKVSDSGKIRWMGKSAPFSKPPNPKISILIPTFNRLMILEKTLLSLSKQAVPFEQFEIIIIDDASEDGTPRYLTRFCGETELKVCCATLASNSGPAAARNIGMSLASGGILFFLGDDIEPGPKLLSGHLKWHEQNPDEKDALLGYVTFPKALNPSHFMKWLEGGGGKYFFNYAAINPGRVKTSDYFYTCNVSLKASVIEKSGSFDVSFPFASHEDLELGWRLSRAGMRLYYDPNLVGYHWHSLSIKGATKRAYLMGYSAVAYWKKIKIKGSQPKRIIRWWLSIISQLPISIKIWEKLRQAQYDDNREYPHDWHALLLLSYFIGFSDSNLGRPIREI